MHVVQIFEPTNSAISARLPCNPHTFRRTFASNLHRAGLDVEHIMRLGGWESLDMVLRYTRSVKFEDSLRVYRGMER
jgi:integrase